MLLYLISGHGFYGFDSNEKDLISEKVESLVLVKQ